MIDSPIHLYSLLIRLSEPNAEFPMISVAITGSGEPAGAALSEHNGLLLSCSSNKNRDSATKPAWCETETQPDLSTQPGSTPSVQEFKPEGQTQDNNANKKTSWWEKIPGASRLFRQPSNNAIPAEFEQSNLCNDPYNFYIYPVCSMQQPYNPGTRTTLILNHCRSCTVISLYLLISLLKIFTNVWLPSGR